ncbi:MAG: CAP domain-containing protein [Legionellaceae bacterium]|nr:CAP domain-containing protein [Legionellaceae bacterium]
MNRIIKGSLRRSRVGLCVVIGLLPMASHANINQNLATEILVYINQYRVQHKLPKLVMNERLIAEARQHSLDMAKHVVPFGHDGFADRMSVLHKEIPNSMAGAENVAYNYKTAEVVANGWIKSSGHRRNIVGNYNLTGIGIAQDSQGKLYYTQMFLKSDDDSIQKKSVKIKRSHSFLSFG